MVQIIWPIVNLKTVENMLNGHINDDLDFVHNTDSWQRPDYDRKALDVTILADTVIIDNDISFNNFKSLKIVSRKLLAEFEMFFCKIRLLLELSIKKF